MQTETHAPIRLWGIIGLCSLFMLLVSCRHTESPLDGIMTEFQPGGAFPVFQSHFSHGNSGWTGLQRSIQLETVAADRGTSQNCLKISGASPKGDWSYAVSPRFHLLPSRTYQVSGWIRVDKRPNESFPPFLKVQIERNPGAVFITNENGPRTVSQWDKQWSQFKFQFTTPPEPGLQGLLSLEKGTDSALPHMETLIDDLTVKLLP